jgi:hypothetical protein
MKTGEIGPQVGAGGVWVEIAAMEKDTGGQRRDSQGGG